MRSIYFLMLLVLLIQVPEFGYSQCNITNLTWTNQACINNDNEFITILDFDHPDPNKTFILQTPYTFQEFQVSDLPVNVGPLPGYCLINNFNYLITSSGCEMEGSAPYQCCANTACALEIGEVGFECTDDGMMFNVGFYEFGCMQLLNYEIIVEKYDGLTLIDDYTFGPFDYNPYSGSNSQDVLIPNPVACAYNYIVKVRDINSNNISSRQIYEYCCQCNVELSAEVEYVCYDDEAYIVFNTNNTENFGINGYTVSIDGVVIETLSINQQQQILYPANCSGQQLLLTVTDILDPGCSASVLIDAPCCPCELIASNINTTVCNNGVFNLDFALFETGSCIIGDYYFLLDGITYNVNDNGNGIFSALEILASDSLVNIEVCNIVAPYCFPLSFLNPCYVQITNDSCELFSFTVDSAFSCQGEFANLSFNYSGNSYFGQNGYVVIFDGQSKTYSTLDPKIFNAISKCDSSKVMYIQDANNQNCSSQVLIESLCCPCSVDSFNVVAGQCDNGYFSAEINLSGLSGSCLNGSWVVTISNTPYQLSLVNGINTIQQIFSTDSILPISICSDFNECYFDTIVNPCYAIMTDVNRIQFDVTNVENIKCEKQGFVTWSQFGALPDFKILLDNVQQPNQDSTIVVLSAGFHTLTISDAFLQKSIVFWIDKVGDTSTFDIQPLLVSGDFVRGFVNDAFLTVKNLSCKPVDAYVTLRYPNHIQYQGSYPSAIDQQNQLLEWYLTDLVDSVVIHIKFKTSSLAPIGHELNFEVKAMPSLNDNNPLNNTKEYVYLVTGSYDPNDKNATPYGKCDAHYILKNQEINYTIRFQNIGNSPAKNVIIKDELNQYLDMSTFRLLSNSHHAFILKDRENVLSFRLDNINLAAQITDEELSKGFITFAVKPKIDVPVNTEIRNKASIYFDFNDAIVTNETFHTIVNKIPDIENELSLTTCEGQAFNLHGETFISDTIFTKSFISKNGCDSLVTYKLKFDKPQFLSVTHDLCFGEKVIIEGNEYSQNITIEIPTHCGGKTTHAVNVTDNIIVDLVNDANVLTLNGTGYDSYTWINCSDNSVVASGEPTFIPSENGTFKIRVEQDGCFYESDCISFIVSSFDINSGKGLVVYPNPVLNGTLNIKLINDQEKIKNITIINSLGQTTNNLIGHQSQINFTNYTSGMYILRIVTDKTEYYKKVLVK